MKSSIDYTDKTFHRFKYKLNELTCSIESIEEDDHLQRETDTNVQTNLTQGTFREKLALLDTLCRSLSEKVGVLEKKSMALSKEVKDNVKASLKSETAKVIEQFKMKLELFTNRFEHELNNKINLMWISSFDNKMNKRLYEEMRDKFDRNELRKNNSLINRKIGSVENKISKTLVDTIIDLQMDEVLLIVKKNINNV